MIMIRKMKMLNIVFWLALLAFTVYFVLDTFVIERVYQPEAGEAAPESISEEYAQAGSVPDALNNAVATGGQEDNVLADDAVGQSVYGEDSTEESAAVITGNSYRDENISIVINEYRVNDTTVYAADVQLSSPEYLKTALAKASYGRNVTAKTSDTASSVDAILAINGDYYGAQEKGYVIRNSVIYRSIAVNGKEDLAIYEDGSFEIVIEGQVSAQELVNSGVVNLLSFGPALVEDGEISVGVNDEVGKAKTSNPRTAIGITDDCHYILVVSDGRTSESEGLSLYELAQVMQQLGAKTAYNLDGGGSSTMWFNGALVNNPTTNGSIKERSVSDIVYIGI
jgi:exopolysaccharide biosynthesis protein